MFYDGISWEWMKVTRQTPKTSQQGSPQGTIPILSGQVEEALDLTEAEKLYHLVQTLFSTSYRGAFEVLGLSNWVLDYLCTCGIKNLSYNTNKQWKLVLFSGTR